MFWIKIASVVAVVLSAVYGVWLSGWTGLIVPLAAAIAVAIGAIIFGVLSFAVWFTYEGIRRLLGGKKRP
jgi:hypothetical protein